MVELMIVIAIIGILAVTLIPAFSGMQNRAKDTGIVSQLNSASLALEGWQVDTNSATFPAVAPAPLSVNLTSQLASFTSLKADKACGPVSSTMGTVTVTSTTGCPTWQTSFGYTPAQKAIASDTYLIWGGLFTPTKGNIATQVTTAGAYVALNNVFPDVGWKKISATATTAYYWVHGGNR